MSGSWAPRSGCCWRRTSSPRGRTCRTARGCRTTTCTGTRCGSFSDSVVLTERYGAQRDQPAQHVARRGGRCEALLTESADAAHPICPRPHRTGQQTAVGGGTAQLQRDVPDLWRQATAGDRRWADEVAANQRAVCAAPAHPGGRPEPLADHVTELPDGIRSALQVAPKQDSRARMRATSRCPLAVEGAQPPLRPPSIRSPFDDPRQRRDAGPAALRWREPVLRRGERPRAARHQPGPASSPAADRAVAAPRPSRCPTARTSASWRRSRRSSPTTERGWAREDGSATRRRAAT